MHRFGGEGGVRERFPETPDVFSQSAERRYKHQTAVDIHMKLKHRAEYNHIPKESANSTGLFDHAACPDVLI